MSVVRWSLFGPRYVSAVIYLDNKSKKELVKVSRLAPFTHTHTHTSLLASWRSSRCTSMHFGVAAAERGLNELLEFFCWEAFKKCNFCSCWFLQSSASPAESKRFIRKMFLRRGTLNLFWHLCTKRWWGKNKVKVVLFLYCTSRQQSSCFLQAVRALGSSSALCCEKVIVY